MESNLYDRIGSHNAKKLKNFFSNGGYFSLYQKGDDLYERILPNEEMTECIEYCLSSKDFVEKEVVLAKYLQNLLAEQKVSTRSYSVCPTIINVPHSTEIPFFPRPEKREVVESITTANIDDRPNASKLAKQFLSAYNVRIYQETIYVLVGSSYHPFTEAEFFRQLNDQFRLAAEHVGTTHLYREIANFIKCENAYVISDNQYLSQAHLICFTDGYLNTDNMLFYSPDPHIFFRTYVNLKYHDILNSGPTPVFDQYLRTVAGSDLLLQNRIMEMIGLCISKVAPPDINVLNQDEGKRLIKAALKRSRPAWIVISLALGTGMRISEIYGLEWQNIDFEKQTLRVNKIVVTTNKGIKIQNSAKTKSSQRTIPLPDSICNALKRYRLWQKIQAIRLGHSYMTSPWVMSNPDGIPRSPNSFSAHQYKDILRNAGLDTKIRIHDLRHTHATWLLEAGINVKVVSERLGHSSCRITLDTYAHCLHTMQSQAVEALNKIL